MRRVYRLNQLSRVMATLLLCGVALSVTSQTMPDWWRRIYDAYEAAKAYLSSGALGGGGGGGF